MELIQAFLTENPCYKANLAKADSRYTAFQAKGPQGLMLHSVGCNQPSAEVFVKRWNRPECSNVCVHGFIDANTGALWQTLPWNYRGWHCGGSGNNTHVGVEMCESAAIRYGSGASFTVLDRARALADCARAYRTAVELFARLCLRYKLDPRTAVCSHKEGAGAGIASGHVDPEHYWKGLGAPYTMEGFRAEVAAALAELEAAETPAPADNESPAPAEGPGAHEETAFPYTDVPADAWYAEALRWALDQKVLVPRPPAQFHPDSPLTKASAVVLLRRLYRALEK
ncbi:MAG: N-acetylmuramoyl-L-alanine amidase [Oscillospiraceae bacterium]|nr:N-acetylmuramoyl-L-alanine amidase [Oscillospiraceae bacterium]